MESVRPIAKKTDWNTEDMPEEQGSFVLQRLFPKEEAENLISSVQLARAAGVDEKRIIDTVEKVDDYFLNEMSAKLIAQNPVQQDKGVFFIPA